MHFEHLGFLKPQFTQLARPWLAVQDGSNVLAGLGLVWNLPVLKSFIHSPPNGDLRMEATENEKVD